MDGILSRLFQKRGISDVNDLTPEERQDFARWQSVLNKEEVTVQDVVEFCNTEIRMIEAQFRNTEDSDEKKARLTLLHSFYSSMRDIITKPKIEREALIKYLEGQLST